MVLYKVLGQEPTKYQKSQKHIWEVRRLLYHEKTKAHQGSWYPAFEGQRRSSNYGVLKGTGSKGEGHLRQLGELRGNGLPSETPAASFGSPRRLRIRFPFKGSFKRDMWPGIGCMLCSAQTH